MNDKTMIEIEGASFKIKTVAGMSKSFTVEDIFSVDENDLTKEFMQQPSIYGYFATAMAVAEDNANRAEYRKDQEYAAADDASRKAMDLNGLKYTETVIRGMVLTDEQYAAAVADELQAKYEYKILKAIVNALEQRANMLVSLGSHLRHEENMTGMNIRDRAIDNMSKNVKDVIRAHRGK